MRQVQQVRQGKESKLPTTWMPVPTAGLGSPPGSQGHSNFAEVITGLGGTTQGREGSGLLTRFGPGAFAAQEQPSLIKVEGKARVVLCCWKNVGLEGRWWLKLSSQHCPGREGENPEE